MRLELVLWCIPAGAGSPACSPGASLRVRFIPAVAGPSGSAAVAAAYLWCIPASAGPLFASPVAASTALVLLAADRAFAGAFGFAPTVVRRSRRRCPAAAPAASWVRSVPGVAASSMRPSHSVCRRSSVASLVFGARRSCLRPAPRRCSGRHLVWWISLSESFEVRPETSPAAVPPVPPCVPQPPPSPCVAVYRPLRQQARTAVRLLIIHATRVHPRLCEAPADFPGFGAVLRQRAAPGP